VSAPPLDATPASDAIVWMTTAVPRTTKPARLDDLGAASVALTPDDLRAIDAAASHITVAGARYPEALEKGTGL